MKKLLSILFVLLFTLSSLTSCFTHPIEEFKEHMDEADNFQMTMTIYDIEYYDKITITMKVDGNITYTPESILGPAEYEETFDDKTYTYTEDGNGNWIKTESFEEDDGTTDFLDEDEIFNPDNYEKVKKQKKTYRQKEDVYFDSLSDVVIKIEDDSYTIDCDITIQGLSYEVRFVFSHFDKINLTLPNV